MPRPTPNFVILNGSLPDVGRLVAAMLKARQAIGSRFSVMKASDHRFLYHLALPTGAQAVAEALSKK